MNQFLKGFLRSFKAFVDLVRLLFRLFAEVRPFLVALLRALQRCCHRPDRRGCCVDVPATSYKRADPMLYSQSWLMKQGLSVTWDNPDIQLYDTNGNPVSPSELKADRDYQVVVRIWNNSYDAPAVGLPVYLSDSTFLLKGSNFVHVFHA